MDFSKPRVAIYYFTTPSSGMRNDGPPLFLNAALRRLLNGVKTMPEMRKDMRNDCGNVVHLWPNKEAKPDTFGTFDLHILVDHGEDAIGVPLDWKIASPSAYWVSDAHLGYGYRLRRAREFDFVFCAQRVFMDQFSKDGIPREKLFYLPHCVDPTAYFPTDIINRWDWAFVGHLNSDKRVNFLDRMMKEFPNWYYGWRMGHIPGWNVLEDVARKFSQAHVVINDSIKEDLNMRVFEALATKRPLLTDNVRDLHDHFGDGKHLMVYRTHDEAVEKMKILLGDEDLRRSISDAGYKEVLLKHTYDNRIAEILEKAIGWKQDKKEMPNELVQTCFAR